MENPVVIIGANHVGKSVLDIFKANDVIVYCFLDEEKTLHDTEIGDVMVIGSHEDENHLSILQDKCEYFVASDDNLFRASTCVNIATEFKKKAVNAIHARSYISEYAEIGHGNLIDMGAILKPFAKIGDGCNINSGAILGVEATIGDYVQIGTNACIQENVTIGDKAFIGAGATIVAGITIGKNARIGAGSVVIADVEKDQTVFGNPAKAL